MDPQEYDASGIEFYQGIDAIRIRPGMYIGDVDSDRGILNMITEIIDNSVDEFMAGHGDTIKITLEKDGNIIVEDNGRGIPVDTHKTGVSAFELVLTQLHAGGKFNTSSYKISGGLHGIGAAAVIGLSEKAQAITIREGKAYTLNFEKGKKIGEITVEPTSKPNGTTIKFLPDPTIFTVTEINYDMLLKRLNEIAYLNKKLTFVLTDNKYNNNVITISHKEGINDFLKKFNKSPLHKPVHMEYADDTFRVSIGLGWQDARKEEIKAFTNNIFQESGGTHVTGLKTAIQKVLLKHYQTAVPQKDQVPLVSEDTRFGLVAIVALYLPNPKFTSQTKDMLSSKEAREIVYKVVTEKLDDWVAKNPNEVKKIFMHITRGARERINFEKKKELIDNKKNDFGSITDKFLDCASNDPREKELFIVEGGSAGGTAREGRNPKVQAVLSIQGKLRNVEKVADWKVWKSKEYVTLMNVLNCGIGSNIELNKIAFHKIIVATDADVDGYHIRILLLLFFYKYMPEAILAGYVYLSRPPLYKINDRSKGEYIANEKKLKNYVYRQFVTKMIPDEKFTQEVYFSLLNYQEIIKEFFQDINYVFVSRLIMAGILDVMMGKKTIEQVEKDFFLVENSELHLKIEKHDENHLVVAMEYQSFYTKYKNQLKFTKEFYDKISGIVNLIKGFFPLKVLMKNDLKSFDEPLLMVDAISNWVNHEVYIQRYKGLGEMNAEQLAETCLDPTKRVIEQVLFDPETVEETDRIFQILLGEDVDIRREYIIDNYDTHALEMEEYYNKDYYSEMNTVNINTNTTGG
jgi:DNA gyrase subunit B